MLKRVEARKKAREEEGSVVDVEEDEEEEPPDDNYTFTYNKSVCNVSLGNDDLSAIVNGFPGDPIDARPFDKYFTRANIISWWVKVGFLPMTRASLNDPKVRIELGEGGAPEEDGKRLELLVEEYEQAERTLTRLGFNGRILNVEPPRAKPREFFATEEAQTQAIIDNKTINKAGGLFKIGVHIANCNVVLEAHRRIKKAEEEEKKRKKKDKADTTTKHDLTAIKAYRKWKREGKTKNGDGSPTFKPASDAMAILRLLLPKVNTGKEVISTYNSGAKAVQRLMKMNDWEAEIDFLMPEILQKYDIEELAAVPLFQVNNSEML